uniref:Uncharacterized protein n=1 Tax=Brassica campestris TaxID=3711 RepID=A0A3P5Z1I7_BRACM|nr:unnamed protein product [Brassica rapa]
MSLLHCARKGSVQGTGKRMENESSRQNRIFAIHDEREYRGSKGDNGFQSGNGMLEAIII